MTPRLLSASAIFLAALLVGCGSTSPSTPASNARPASPDAATADTTSPSPVSYVYLAWGGTTGGDETPQLDAYSMDAAGAFSNVPGVNLPGDALGVADNGQYVFVSSGAIYAYQVASNGGLSLSATSAATNPYTLSLDRTGKTLYAWGGTSENYGYESYAVGTKGALTYLNTTPAPDGNLQNGSLSFTTDNLYAFNSACNNGQPVFYGFSRAASGALTAFNTGATLPAGVTVSPDYPSNCLFGAAVPGNAHVIFVIETNQSKTDLAVYNIASNGTLTTTNTSANIASLPSLGVSAYQFDPTGTWLAVANAHGLHLFKFGGGVLHPTDSVAIPGGSDQLAWDNTGHIYWFGQSCCGYFYVYSVSSEGKLTQEPPNDPTGVIGTNTTWFLAVHPAS
jgi:6-phosphogluconolactonase (cycloisomerase 2 family)